MIITATLLIAVGVVSSLLGVKLFRLLLPFLGLITGVIVGFTGFQGIFGTGAVSTAMAVVIALVVGLLLAVLSYVFFDLAAIFLTIVVGAMAASYLGVALGLREDGFIVFMLAIAGGILGGVLAVRYAVSVGLVIAVTSLLGVAYILTGLMLVVGSVSLNDIQESGVVRTLLEVVDQSFLWFLVWAGGSIITMQLQYRLLLADILSSAFEYTEKPVRK